MIETVTATLPGVFYRASAPGQPACVQEGDRVQADDPIGLIEVMKNFSEVCAEQAGTVRRFLVESETPVDVGEPIAELET